MKKRLWSEHPAARAEFLAVVASLPPTVAQKFVERVREALADIRTMPHAWPKVSFWIEPPTLRRRKAKPFRVNVVYHVDDNVISVIAYAHEAREPGYWRDRVVA